MIERAAIIFFNVLIDLGEIFMKKIGRFIIIFSVVLVSIFSVNVAAETLTENIPDEQLVQVLPEGGFIMKTDGSSEFNSELVRENNGSIMTYKEYCSLGNENVDTSWNPGETYFRATRPSGTNTKVLANGETYRSQVFSGRGWRFSNFGFRPASGTGYYLAWQTFVDDGRVGDYNSAMRTYSGTLKGTPLYRGTRRYVISNLETAMFYYTYNPIPGTYYIVQNF